MNVVDSSGWLEYFSGTANAESFSKLIENFDKLIVPSVTLTEVFKRILQQRDEQSALQAVAHMQQGRVIPLNATIAIKAARIGYDFKLPLADSIILATAQLYQAVLWTQDEDFKNIPGGPLLSKTLTLGP
jgi:predicted nucleic acid-binding protein